MSNIKYVISATDQTADAWRSAESTATASLNKMSAAAQMSAKQFTAAMRYVPAQFTDIVVGLSTGQSPLTVLLQQGGQLKDMFGGVGNAAKALGMYVAGLVNPFSIAAAAGAGLAYVYNAGAEESSKLAKAIIMSGNAAGVTAGQLSDLSKSISAATGATRSEVADVLEQAVATGDISADNLSRVSAAAIAMEQATGRAVGETIQDFVELGNGYKMLKATIESTIIRATILPMVQGQINGLLGAITGSGAGAATKKATEGGQSSSMLGDAFDWLSSKLPSLASLFSANGNIFERGQVVHAFANGGVVSSATPFRYAGGLGVMGEAGPEAILPLRRTAAGKLGVVAQTNAPQPAQAPTPAIHINFNVTGQVDSRTAQQMATQAGSALQRALRRNG